MKTQTPDDDGARGAIVNIASVAGVQGFAGEPVYCATKGGVVNLTRQLALEFGPDAIRVNVVCPGFHETSTARPFLSDPDIAAAITARQPWPRTGTADDIAKAVGFLASSDATFISGQCISVDGGYVAG